MLLLCVAIQLLLLLLLFVVVCRMAKIVAVVYCMCFQCFLSLHHSNTTLLLMHVHLGSTVAFAASIYL